MEDHRWRGHHALVEIALSAVALCVALAAAPPAHAHPGHALSERVAERAIGASAAPAGDGLYRVRAGGATFTTHGPDPAPASDRIATRGAEAILGVGGPERPPACATDHYQQVLVAHLAGAPDRVGEVADQVRAHVRRMNWLLNADALASGDVTADYKVRCDEAGQIRVDSFAAASGSFEDVVAAARAAGFAEPNADYTIFFDGLGPGGGCGIGTYRADERLVADNRSNTGGGYGITYQPCWFGITPMHENAHNQGAVQYSAPNSTGSGGHCSQGHDVLCYAPDGGDRNQAFTVACAERVHFDCGGDDYFDPAPEPGEYLESHWNLGSPLNRYIRFGQPERPGPAAPEPPSAAEPRRMRLGATVGGELGPGAALYRVRVPGRRRSLTVQVASPAPLALTVRRGAAPDSAAADCTSSRSGPRQTCRIQRPPRGNWYVGVADPAGAGGVSFRLTASAAAEGRRR